MVTRIVVTETEETYYQIKVVTSDKVALRNVEMNAIDRMLADKAWVREQFVYDVRDLTERVKYAGVVQEMVSIMYEGDAEILQVVYETDIDKRVELKNLGFTSVEVEESGMDYFLREITPITQLSSDDGEPAYENISTDIEHVHQHMEFHTTKITQDPLLYADEHIVNKDDVVLFLNYGETSQVFRTFLNHNTLLGLEYHLFNTETDSEQIAKVMEDEELGKNDKFILVTSPFREESEYITIIDKYKSKIKMVVHETDYSHASVFLLSTCKKYGIAHTKRIQHGAFFNFGVTSEHEKCSKNVDDAKNGLISLNDDVWVSGRSYAVFLDPRYADIKRFINAMELSPDVWTVTVIQDCNDLLSKGMYDYKFFPVYQTENLTSLHKTMKSGLIHTPIAFYTRFPAIATLLFDASIFVSCEKEHLLEYVNKVTDAFKNKINEQFVRHLSKINSAKVMASDMRKKVVFVKDAIQRRNHDKLVHEIGMLQIKD